MKSRFMTFVTFTSVCMLFIGGCSIMDELGNLQPSGAVLAILGGLNLFVISRRCNIV